jgi:hypothetical protein
VVGACGVVVLTTGGVREREVGVVYELEFAGSFGAFWGIGWDAVGVGFEGCSGELLVTTSKEDEEDGGTVYRHLESAALLLWRRLLVLRLYCR